MSGPLRLAVDARDLAGDTQGIGRYARAILRRLALRSDVQLTLLVYGPFAFRHRGPLRTALQSDRFRIATKASRGEVVWHPGNGTFFDPGPHSVVTLHDAMPFCYPCADPKERDHQQAPFLRSARTGAHFIAVSQFGRDELVRYLHLDPARITVIHHGVDAAFSPGPAVDLPPGLSAPYVLFVGNPASEPPKNFPLLYDALRRAFPLGEMLLTVVGPRDPGVPQTQYAGLVRSGASLGGDPLLRSLYRGSVALCVPSYHETFGMPMIEAMACGTPVLAADATALPEVGGHAALYVAPHDTDAWTGALRRIADDSMLRAELREKGLARAHDFDWETCTRKHLDVFRAAAQ